MSFIQSNTPDALYCCALQPMLQPLGKSARFSAKVRPAARSNRWGLPRRTFLALAGRPRLAGALGGAGGLRRGFFAAFNRGGIPTDMTHQTLALLLGEIMAA